MQKHKSPELSAGSLIQHICL